MKFCELEGIMHGVKIRASNWDPDNWVRWINGVFLKHTGCLYPFTHYDVIEQEWEYYQEPEPRPEVCCPICDGPARLEDTNQQTSFRVACGHLFTRWVSTKEEALEIWRKLGGVR